MSELLKLQQTFSRNVALLLLHADTLGFGVTLGEAWRSPEAAKLNAKRGTGISNSLHIDRLAIDINLFLGDQYLPTTADHQQLGEYWKTLHPLNRWGGEFGDGNHYSMTYQGRK